MRIYWVLVIILILGINSDRAEAGDITLSCEDIMRDSKFLLEVAPLEDVDKLGAGHRWFGGHVYLVHPPEADEESFVRKIYRSEKVARGDKEALAILQNLFDRAPDDFGFDLVPVRRVDGPVMDLDYEEGRLISDLDPNNEEDQNILNIYTRKIEEVAKYISVLEYRGLIEFTNVSESLILGTFQDKRALNADFRVIETGKAYEFWLKADNILYKSDGRFVVFDPN